MMVKGYYNTPSTLGYQPVNILGLAVVWENYKALKRCTAGWRIDDTGWYSPDGQHESEWTGPLPEYTLL